MITVQNIRKSWEEINKSNPPEQKQFKTIELKKVKKENPRIGYIIQEEEIPDFCKSLNCELPIENSKKWFEEIIQPWIEKTDTQSRF